MTPRNVKTMHFGCMRRREAYTRASATHPLADRSARWRSRSNHNASILL
jgi:hypothetical protein